MKDVTIETISGNKVVLHDGRMYYMDLDGESTTRRSLRAAFLRLQKYGDQGSVLCETKTPFWGRAILNLYFL